MTGSGPVSVVSTSTSPVRISGARTPVGPVSPVVLSNVVPGPRSGRETHSCACKPTFVLVTFK